jgi:mono/diheme cytochrome c family protein
MRRIHTIVCAFALASGILAPFPRLLIAQTAKSSSSDAQPGLYDRQRRGEFVFIKNCALCHLRDGDRPANSPIVGKEAADVFGAELRGMFKDRAIHEDNVRQIIAHGIPKTMPGFQYTLDSKQIDELIAFFKVPYPPQPNAGK